MELLNRLLGLSMESSSYGFLQLVARALLMYVAAFLLIRVAKNRVLGKNTAFDVVFGSIFGSMPSRAINGTGPFFPTLAAAGARLLLDWLLGAVTARSARAEDWLEGSPTTLVRDGRVLDEKLRSAQITENELRSTLRLRGLPEDPTLARLMCLERTGAISVVPRPREPQVVEIGVREGVQRVHLELQLV